MADVVLTVEEAAHYLKVSEVTIRRWCTEGKLPAFRIGRGWRIAKCELDEMMQCTNRVIRRSSTSGLQEAAAEQPEDKSLGE